MQKNPDKIDQFSINKTLAIKEGYLWPYTMQQYITKSKQGERRPTKAYEQIINNVPNEIETSLGKILFCKFRFPLQIRRYPSSLQF